MAYTEDELNALPPEERDALEGIEGDDGLSTTDDPEKDELESGDGDGEEGADKGDEDTPDVEAAAGDDGGEGEEAAGEEASGEGKEEADPAAPAKAERREENSFLPSLNGGEVEGIDEQLSALDDKFDNGEMTMREYNAQRDPLIAARTKAEMIEAVNEQVADSLWDRQQTIFKNSHPEYNDPIRHAALAAGIQQLIGAEEAVGKDGFWFLDMAHKIVEESLGNAREAGKTEDTPAAEAPSVRRPVKDSGNPAREKAPTTLAGLPAADTNETGDSNFDALDNMDGVDFEAALSSMNEAERDKYLAAS